MRRALLVILVLGSSAGAVCSQTSPPAFTPRDESPEEFAAGPGRDETFYACTACHNFKLVAQQGLSRERWDETLTFMTSGTTCRRSKARSASSCSTIWKRAIRRARPRARAAGKTRLPRHDARAAMRSTLPGTDVVERLGWT